MKVEKIIQSILLMAIPGLMFCVLPVPGMEFRFSWQLVSLWLGGIAFVFLVLSNWWMRGLFLLALIRTATLPPNLEAYITLVMIAVFLTAAKGFSRIDPERVMNAICWAAIALLAWMAGQRIGLLPVSKTVLPGLPTAGPFNIDEAGIFLALCLSAAMRGKWIILIPFILLGMILAPTSTGILAAASGAGVFLWLKFRNRKKIILSGAFIVCLSLGLLAFTIEPWQGVVRSPRWAAWKHSIWSMRSEKLGRGLGSWKDIFPLLASGDRRLGMTANEGNRLNMSEVWLQAHNEYIQTAFELGLQAAVWIGLFLAAFGLAVFRGHISPQIAAGMITLIVGCAGFFVMHVAPTALLGCAWLGIWEGKIQNVKNR